MLEQLWDCPWSPSFRIARFLLALSLFSTLVGTATSDLFTPLADNIRGPDWSLFRLAGLDAGRGIALAVLLLVMSGRLPGISSLFHFWVAASFASSAVLLDGGDHVIVSLSLLMIPVATTDLLKDRSGRLGALGRLFACYGRMAMMLQVVIIYLHAAISKLSEPHWIDGTAIYYWFTHPLIGPSSGVLGSLLSPLIETSIVCIITWGSILLEFALAASPLLPRRQRVVMFFFGVGFHAGIIVIFGLNSFGLSMFAALLLLCEPLDPIGKLTVRVRDTVRWRGRRPLEPDQLSLLLERH